MQHSTQFCSFLTKKLFRYVFDIKLKTLLWTNSALWKISRNMFIKPSIVQRPRFDILDRVGKYSENLWTILKKCLWMYFRMSSFEKDVQGSQAYKAEGRKILFQSLVDTTKESWKLFSPTLWSELIFDLGFLQARSISLHAFKFSSKRQPA